MPPQMPYKRDLASAAGEWLGWLEKGRGLSPTTIRTYRSSLRQAFNPLPSNYTEGDLLEACNRRMNREQPAVRRNTWNACNGFFGWWRDHGGPLNPLRDMKPPGRPIAHRPALTDAQVSLIVMKLQSAEPKGRAMLYPLLTHGARLSDVVNLMVEDVRLAPVGLEAIRFRNRKGGVDSGWIRMGPLLTYVMRSYLEVYKIPGGYLFTGRKGKMTTEAIAKRWRMLTGSPLQGMAHQARHRFAVELLRRGANVNTLRKLLDHASLATTQLYLDYDDEAEETALLSMETYLRSRGA